MEITLKTMDEINDQRVSLTMLCQDQAEAVKVFGRLIGSAEELAEPGDETSWYHVALGRKSEIRNLRRQIVNLNTTIERNLRQADGADKVWSELVTQKEAEIDTLKLKVQGYDHDRHTEQLRANENRAWAERAEARIADLETRLRDKATQIDNVKQTLNETSTPREKIDNVWAILTPEDNTIAVPGCGHPACDGYISCRDQ